MSEVKQVIVIRKDLKMRRGKEIAQGAHASMAWLAKRVKEVDTEYADGKYVGGFPLTHEEDIWLSGSFTKITLQVDSEEALMAVYEAAKATDLEVHLITDSGATEFNGVPTRTCLAIGPDRSSVIDKITANLKLY